MASGIELFRLMARLVLDTSEFDKGIDGAKKQTEGLGGAFDGAESKVTKLASAMTVVKNVSSAVAGVFKSASSAAMGLVEVSGNIAAMNESMTSTFANLRPIAESFFKQISDLNNIETGRLQQSGLGFFRQFAGAGLPDSIAITETARALGLAADAAAAADISLEEASEMMRSFIRGNVEAGEAIGVFTSATARDNEAMEKYGKTWKELNEAQQQFLMLDKVESTYRRSGVYGQGAREKDNWTNVTGNFSRVWTEAQALMGDEMRVALIPALKDLTQWVKDNPDLFKNLGKVFGEVVKSMVGAFQSLLTFVSEHGDTITAFFDSLNFLLSGGNSAEFTNKGRPQGTEEEKRAAALAYLTGEGLYSDMERVFGGKNAATRYLSDKFNSADGEITKEVAAQWVDEAMAELQKDVDAANITAKVNMQPDFSGFFSGLGNIISAGANWFFGNRPGEGQGVQFNAKGLAYVPYDNYLTQLHRGESVLNRVEAEDWRAAKRGENMGFDPAAVGDAVKAALAGVSISMDSRTVGALVTPYVSREQAAEAWRRR